MTNHIDNIVKAKINKDSDIIQTYAADNISTFKSIENININDYHKVLSIELKKCGKINVLNAIKAIEKRDDVIYVGPDYIIKSFSNTPNDTYYLSNNQWAINRIQLDDAWDITTGNSNITVGILDTGIDSTHPDLINRIDTSKCYDFTSGSTVAVSNPTDPIGHGTHVAGIIGAQGNNNLGISGVCWNIKLASLRVIDSNDHGYSSSVIAAINVATAQGIQILNFSGGWEKDSTFYDAAIEASIRSYPGLFICAAGNSNLDLDDTQNIYPAVFDAPNLITVGAFNSLDNIWFNMDSGSNYGEETVDIFAPGESILSCFPTQLCISGTCNTNGEHVSNGYHSISGTSMAAPFVSGVAALLLSKYPNLSISEVKQKILDNAEEVSNIHTEYDVFGEYCSSGGILNAYRVFVPHYHSYTYENCGDNHKCTCTVCNYVKYEAHNWVYSPIYPSSVTPQYIPQYLCEKCGAISLGAPASALSTEEHLHISRE